MKFWSKQLSVGWLAVSIARCLELFSIFLKGIDRRRSVGTTGQASRLCGHHAGRWNGVRSSGLCQTRLSHPAPWPALG